MNPFIKVAFVFVFICWPMGRINTADAQKPLTDAGPVGIFSSTQEYYQFMGQAKQAAYGEGGNPELQAMIPMLNDIVLNRPVGSSANQYRSNGSTLDLLADERVRKEIDMLDDQYEELRSLSQTTWQQAANKIRGLDFSNQVGLVEQIRAIQAAADKQVNNVLLPHQLERLRQLHFRSKLRRGSFVGLLTSDPIKSNLEITDEQAKELTEFDKVVQEELADEIAKLREAARARLLTKLRPSQAKKAKELIGDAFRFPQSEKENAKRAKGKGKNGKATKSDPEVKSAAAKEGS